MVAQLVMAWLAFVSMGAAQEAPRPRVIVLGIDGMDARLTEQWMAEGHLPNLKRLADMGTYSRLLSTNPAVSPAAWASVVTGRNPGKTNLFGFIRRTNESRYGQPMPAPAGVSKLTLPLDEVPATVLAELMRSSGLARDEMPATLPWPKSEIATEPFWNELDRAGVRLVGLKVPGAFPVQPIANGRILSGLFTPDVAGGPGAWFIYTNDDWYQNGAWTETGGTIFKVQKDADGIIQTSITGPKDFVTADRFDRRIESLQEQISDAHVGDVLQRLIAQKNEVYEERRLWSEHSKARTDFTIQPNYADRSVTLGVGPHREVVGEGGCSDLIPIQFTSPDGFPTAGLVRFHVIKCHSDDEGSNALLIYVPPISLDPADMSPLYPVSHPTGYVADLAADVGPYQVHGWTSPTNALKDNEIGDQTFMAGVSNALDEEARLIHRELGQSDWDILFATMHGADHVGHLAYRFQDPQHPLFDQRDADSKPLREQTVQAFGRSFPMHDAIMETYRETDRLVGEVMESAPDAQLIVLSDHGIESFRCGVNLNVWLARNGYLKAHDPRQSGDMLTYVDWSGTQAYSMGLGKIFLNLRGREPKGIVGPDDARRLAEEIIAKLKAFKDSGHDNASVVHNAYYAPDMFDGPHEDADIIVGFASGYRVSWQTALGGYEAEAFETDGILVNDLAWSGDHAGVDPSLVPGVLFSSRPLELDQTPSVLDIAPTLLSTFGVPVPSDYDGRLLPTKGD